MAEASAAAPAKPWYKILYIQVLLAILLGAILGWLFPDFGKNDWVKALGDGFVKLIRMVIAPIIFCTVVSGIAHISEVKKVGRVAVKALVYFEVVSTFALLLVLLSPMCCIRVQASPVKPMPPQLPDLPNRPAR
jgi:aerobic C4-dicarboxylate transport protein